MHQHQPQHRRRPHGRPHPRPALATATGPATPTGGLSVPATGTATHRDSAPQACLTA
ncbi:hypothetical protein [Streptomyces azureus]|uniref:hypothetical protein n=1 Tax=Streptomyces azureus TaxID=146537 RepID=UPI000A69F699|nr:hypothetical protein [Streptomyces azureus]